MTKNIFVCPAFSIFYHLNPFFCLTISITTRDELNNTILSLLQLKEPGNHIIDQRVVYELHYGINVTTHIFFLFITMPHTQLFSLYNAVLEGGTG